MPQNFHDFVVYLRRHDGEAGDSALQIQRTGRKKPAPLKNLGKKLKDYARPRYLEVSHTEDGLAVLIGPNGKAIKVERSQEGFTVPSLFDEEGNRLQRGGSTGLYRLASDDTKVPYTGDGTLFFREEKGELLDSETSQLSPQISGTPTKADGTPSKWMGLYSAAIQGIFMGGPVGLVA